MTENKTFVNQCFILADANLKIGTGHIMRTYILAQKLSKLNIEVTFLLANTSEKIKNWLTKQDQTFEEIKPQVRNNAQELIPFLTAIKKGKQLLLLDSDEPAFYKTNFQKTLRQFGIGIAMITLRNYPFNLDILHNQNPLSLKEQYEINSEAKKLLGLNFLIVKNEYISLYEKSKTKNNPSVKTLLLTFGGADSKRLTVRVIKVLNNLPKHNKFKINVIVGALNQDYELINSLTENTHHDYVVYYNTPEMPKLMFESDLSINSGGLTVWELAICNTINFLIPTSDREIMTSEYLKAENLIFQEGDYNQITDQSISKTVLTIVEHKKKADEMCRNFHKLVNPGGADLLIKEIDLWYNSTNSAF